MLALLFSLISSLCVGLFIKLLKIKKIKDLFLMIFINYIIAIAVSFFLFSDQLIFTDFNVNSLSIILILGILMPTIFFILNKSLTHSGLAKTDIFQRISLIIPVALSFILFNETFSVQKLIVILLAFISIFLLLYKKSTKNVKFNTIYLLAVFFGYGIVDTLFKLLAADKQVPYIAALFLVFIVCAIVSFIYLLFTKGLFNKKFLLYGVILGILNFSNIFFYMKAHKIFSDSPTLVFITMNLGIIIGGSIIGKFYFKEKLSKNSVTGIFLAIISVLLLALIQTGKI